MSEESFSAAIRFGSDHLLVVSVGNTVVVMLQMGPRHMC